MTCESLDDEHEDVFLPAQPSFESYLHFRPALLKSAMSSILSYLNPTPSFPPYTGPYPVGSTDVEIPVSSLPQTIPKPPTGASTIAFRLFYPCQTPTDSPPSARPIRWIPRPQKEVLTGVWRFLGLSNALSHALSYALPHLNLVSLPAQRDALLADPPSTNPSPTWPIMIFSHGLGGSRNAYSHLCGSLASYGVVVVAPDHRDGSQPAAFVRATDDADATRVEYRKLSHQPTAETFHGRDAQLRLRIWEVNLCLSALHQIAAGDAITDLHTSRRDASARALASMSHRLDLSAGRIAFAGHSFGATTMIQTLKSTLYYHIHHSTPSPTLLTDPHPTAPLLTSITSTTPTILLDPWSLPLTSPATHTLYSLPLPSHQSLTILSSAFANWHANLSTLLSTIASPNDEKTAPPPCVFVIEKSAHLSQSDFGILFPTLTRYLAHAEEPRRIIQLNVRAILALLRRAGIPVQAFAARDDEDGDGDAEEGFVFVGKDSEGEGEGEGDARILSAREGVRGWRRVSVSVRRDDQMEKSGGEA